MRLSSLKFGQNNHRGHMRPLEHKFPMTTISLEDAKAGLSSLVDDAVSGYPLRPDRQKAWPMLRAIVLKWPMPSSQVHQPSIISLS